MRLYPSPIYLESRAGVSRGIALMDALVPNSRANHMKAQQNRTVNTLWAALELAFVPVVLGGAWIFRDKWWFVLLELLVASELIRSAFARLRKLRDSSATHP